MTKISDGKRSSVPEGAPPPRSKRPYEEERMLWTHFLHGVRELLAVALCEAMNSGDEEAVRLSREQVCEAVDDITGVLQFLEAQS